MPKTLKMSILIAIITLGFLFLGTEVKAVYIEPTSLAESLKGKDVTKCDITKIEKPVKDGYTFKGWYTEETGGKSLETVMSSEDGIKEDTTFYAQWEENESEVPSTGSGEGQTSTDNNNTESTDIQDTGSNNNNTSTGNNPQTGDNILCFVGMLLIAVIGITVTTKIRKYSKTK